MKPSNLGFVRPQARSLPSSKRCPVSRVKRASTSTNIPTSQPGYFHRGLDEAQIEELVSDQLTLNRVKDLLGAGVHNSESETAENYERAYGKMDVAVVRFRNEDFDKDIKI